MKINDCNSQRDIDNMNNINQEVQQSKEVTKDKVVDGCSMYGKEMPIDTVAALFIRLCTFSSSEQQPLFAKLALPVKSSNITTSKI